MNVEKYQAELLRVLREHSEYALEMLKAMDAALPDKATGINIGVHPSQDTDGMFSVMVHLDGPDLYALNKEIAGYRSLFVVRYVDGALTPIVPLFDPFDLKFEVNDVIVDTAFIWLDEIWKTLGGAARDLPATAFGEDGYGTKNKKRLSSLGH